MTREEEDFGPEDGGEQECGSCPPRPPAPHLGNQALAPRILQEEGRGRPLPWQPPPGLRAEERPPGPGALGLQAQKELRLPGGLMGSGSFFPDPEQSSASLWCRWAEGEGHGSCSEGAQRPGLGTHSCSFLVPLSLRAGVAFLTCWEGTPRAGGLLRVKTETLQALPQVSPWRSFCSPRSPRHRPCVQTTLEEVPTATVLLADPTESTCLPSSCRPALQTIALHWAVTARGPHGPRPGGGRASRRCEPTEGRSRPASRRPPPKSCHSPRPTASQNTVFLKPQECSVCLEAESPFLD